MIHSFDIHYTQKLDVICFICQIVSCILPKLMVLVINVNFEPLLQVLKKYLLQFDKFLKILMQNLCVGNQKQCQISKSIHDYY